MNKNLTSYCLRSHYPKNQRNEAMSHLSASSFTQLSLLTSFWQRDYVAFLFTSTFRGHSIHCLNVLGPALLHESSQQCYSPIRSVWPQSHSVVHIQQATSATLRKCLDHSWLLQGKYEFVVVVFLFWVLHLWWLTDLCFNILETFHLSAKSVAYYKLD